MNIHAAEQMDWKKIKPHLPADLSGWRVLDIGGDRGFYALELASHGAHVRAIDQDGELLAIMCSTAVQCGYSARTEFEQKQVYDLASEWERYDLILFLGIHRLRYPQLALDIVAQKVKRLLVLQVPTTSGIEAMLQKSGLRIVKRLSPELCLCEPDPEYASRSWAGEYEAAVGLAPRLTKTLHFQNCWVNTSPGYTETGYHDGTRVSATAEDGPEYSAKAAQFGYGDDLAALSREHEILHTFLAEKFGYGASPTLWAVAHGQTGNVAPIWEQEEEEAWVLAFQTYLHGGGVTEPLGRFTEAGLDVDALCTEARRLLR